MNWKIASQLMACKSQAATRAKAEYGGELWLLRWATLGTESITVLTPIPLHLQEVIGSVSEPSLSPMLSSPAP